MIERKAYNTYIIIVLINNWEKKHTWWNFLGENFHSFIFLKLIMKFVQKTLIIKLKEISNMVFYRKFKLLLLYQFFIKLSKK